ncbi:MAG: mevalonate kinase [Anaerolineae bacterium]|nr:MAG: mevalonate kinase [Anaerolineae bacterium]
MKVTRVTAPGKIILFGEHAVVYGRPAIAAPVTCLRATAQVKDSSSGGVRLSAPDLNRDYWLLEAGDDDPFARAVRVLLEAANLESPPDLKISVKSEIPIASGLGSGAAMAAAVIRALAQHLDLANLNNNENISKLTYKVEKMLHGTPSGIDNTCVVYEQPVYFVRQQPKNHIETLAINREMLFLIADSGIASSTKEVVDDVRRQWLAEKGYYEQIFDSCGRIAQAAKEAIRAGDEQQLGQLMNENHKLLVQMRVSSKELDKLVFAAMTAGALGAKMSGGGRGGNMITLVEKSREDVVRDSLHVAGAESVFTSLLTEKVTL